VRRYSYQRSAASGQNRKPIFCTNQDSLLEKLASRSIAELSVKLTSRIQVNGKEVLERWESAKYDAILMDLDLPDISGLQICMTIREKEQSLGSHTPIIAVTGHTNKELILRCISSGMNAYVTKPIDFKLLVGTLKKWIPTYTMN